MVASLVFFKVALFFVDDLDLYWYLYDTSTDILLVALSLALFSSISYSLYANKITSYCMVMWFSYITIHNAVLDYRIVSSNEKIMFSLVVIILFTMMFLARFCLKWHPSKTELREGNLYEVIGRPKTWRQLIIAMYTGDGGTFAITDGHKIWRYSKNRGCMIVEDFGIKHSSGRMILKIGLSSSDKLSTLDNMIGQKFSFMHNCLQLRNVSCKWR
jgi:hypothetical protein